MQKGIITLSFDDGRKDTYHVFKDILFERKLPGVVYIPSGYIETGYDNPLEVGYNGLMDRDQLDDIWHMRLFEIAGHGDFHKNDFTDIKSGIEKLKAWYPDIHEFGFASPHSSITSNYVYEHLEEYKKLDLAYVRGGRNFNKFKQVRRMISLIARITKSSKLFMLCYRNSLNYQKNYFLTTVAINRQTTLNQLKGIVDYCYKKKAWAILEFHGIDKKNSREYLDYFCWDEENFIKLCDYITDLRDKECIMVKNPIDAIKII